MGRVDQVQPLTGRDLDFVLFFWVALGLGMGRSLLWVRAGAEVWRFPSACFYVIRNYGKVNIR